MLALLFQILFSTGFRLGVKAASIRNRNMIVVGGLNYIAAAVFATIWFLNRGSATVGWSGGVYGGLNGIAYFIAYFFLIYAIRHQGVAATAAVGQLGTVIPILFSIFLWKEFPNSLQWIGMAIAGASILLLDARKDLLDGITRTLRWVLFAFMVITGVARVFAKAFAESGVPHEKAFYVWMVYATSGAVSLAMLRHEGSRPTREEWIWGTFVGLCNMVQMAFFLRALEELAGIIVFPVAAAGGVLLTTIVAVLALGERPTKRLYLGIVSSTVAVILLNWQPSNGSG